MWKNTTGRPDPDLVEGGMSGRSPQHYRNRARELRAEAASREEEISREILIHVAEQCEQMAAEIEARAVKAQAPT
jgi:hypothetical protein